MAENHPNELVYLSDGGSEDEGEDVGNGWVKYIDPDNQTSYFYHATTDETTWQDPTGTTAATAATAATATTAAAAVERSPSPQPSPQQPIPTPTARTPPTPISFPKKLPVDYILSPLCLPHVQALITSLGPAAGSKLAKPALVSSYRGLNTVAGEVLGGLWRTVVESENGSNTKTKTKTKTNTKTNTKTQVKEMFRFEAEKLLIATLLKPLDPPSTSAQTQTPTPQAKLSAMDNFLSSRKGNRETIINIATQQLLSQSTHAQINPIVSSCIARIVEMDGGATEVLSSERGGGLVVFGGHGKEVEFRIFEKVFSSFVSEFLSNSNPNTKFNSIQFRTWVQMVASTSYTLLTSTVALSQLEQKFKQLKRIGSSTKTRRLLEEVVFAGVDSFKHPFGYGDGEAASTLTSVQQFQSLLVEFSGYYDENFESEHNIFFSRKVGEKRKLATSSIATSKADNPRSASRLRADVTYLLQTQNIYTSPSISINSNMNMMAKTSLLRRLFDEKVPPSPDDQTSSLFSPQVNSLATACKTLVKEAEGADIASKSAAEYENNNGGFRVPFRAPKMKVDSSSGGSTGGSSNSTGE